MRDLRATVGLEQQRSNKDDMAAALVEVAAEAGEAEGAGEAEAGKGGLTPDSESNAVSKGVELAKIVSEGLSVASSVLSLVTTIKKGKEDVQDIRERRLAAGLLLSTENRSKLLGQGRLASYWGGSNIRTLINAGKLPFGWGTSTAVGQGFGPEVAAFLLRQRKSSVAARRGERLKRVFLSEKIRLAASENERGARARTAAERIRGSIAG